MLGRVGTIRTSRAGARALCAAALAVIAVAGCGESDGDERSSLLDTPVEDVDVDNESTSTSDHDDVRIESRSYQPGDCVDWEAEGFGVASRDAGSHHAGARVVDCSAPHWVQVTEEVEGPDGDGYPSDERWTTFIQRECLAAGERFLGVQLDPHGRFSLYAIRPGEDGWDLGERNVWCGLHVLSPEAPDGRSTQDIRDADQTYAFAPGTCVAAGTQGELRIVGCAQPHVYEIASRADFSDLTSWPSRQVVDDRCRAAVDDYLAGPLAEPWRFGYLQLTQDSWDTGTRTTHCFLAQGDGDGNLIEVTGSAKG